ncbi:glycosyltransferase family 39 protein [Chloroflexota bacterium]
MDSSESTSTTTGFKKPKAVYDRLELPMIFLIVLVALLLRTIHLDRMEFKGDEAFNLMKAREIAELQSFPLRSATSSTGIPEPPIFMYLLSIPLVFSDDAVFVTGYIALINVLGVVLCFVLVRRFVSRSAALVAAALYAVSPWQVLFSRKIWTQNLFPSFVLLFLLLLFESVYRKRPHLIIFALGLLAIIIQLHLSAIYLVPFTFLFFIWHRQNISLRYIGFGIALASLLFLPYIIDIIYSNFEAIRIAFDQASKPFVLRPRGITLPFQLVTTNGFEYSLGTSYEEFSRNAPRLAALDYSMMVLCIIGLGIALFNRSSAVRALALYTFISLGFFVLNKTELYAHYFNSLLPVLFILCALPVAAIFSKGISLWKWLTAFGFAALLVYQLSFTISFLGFIDRTDCIWGDYGPPYRARVESVRSAIRDIKSSGNHLDFGTIHERSHFCVKWDQLATQYVIEKLEDTQSGYR